MFRKILTTLLMGAGLPAFAEVTLDGTLGHSGTLPGPDYQIGAELGQQHGGNLFHSFQDFNLQSHESATFSGPANVQNIISRVTGGNPSSIDGTLRSTIPNADLYFLNPYGILFGPNAKLDVQGGFHASTADYLQLSDGSKFEVRQPGQSLLTTAPVAAFGFLTDSPATVSLQNSQLTVPYGQTLSLIGGNLSLTGTQVNAPGGQVTLSSLAQAGQLTLANPTLLGKGGTIELQNQSKVSTSGIGGGKVLIRGGQLVMDHSAIQAHTLGNQDGKGIDIVTSESVTTKGELFAINTPTFGDGKGGDIQITTPRLEVTGSTIDTSSLGKGAGGDLKVQADQVSLQTGGSLTSNAFAEGASGNIRVTARDWLTVVGRHTRDFDAYGKTVFKYNSTIAAMSFNKGPSGNIQITTAHFTLDDGTVSLESIGLSEAHNLTIDADSVTLINGGIFTSNTWGDASGGTIILNVTGDLIIIGRGKGIISPPPPFDKLITENVQSAITSSTLGKGPAGHITITANRLFMQEGAIASSTMGDQQGHAGNIHIITNELQLTQGGSIASSSGLFVGNNMVLGTGDGGNLDIEVAGSLRIQGANQYGFPSGLFSNTLLMGRGGNVKVNAHHLQLGNGGLITASSFGVGNAGELTIQADTLEILDDSEITTSAHHAAGGDIHLAVRDQLYLYRGQLTTSVIGGLGDGGNITLGKPQFAVMNHGQIIAQADEGHGGNIRIIAEQFIPSADSLVSASSRLGIDGQVMIAAPNENVGNKLLLSSFKPQNAASQLKQPCYWATLEAYQNRSRFYVYPLNGSPQTPEDWHPSPLLSLSQFSQARSISATGEAQRGVKPAARQVAAGVGECRKLD